MDLLERHIEALIFVSEDSITIAEIRDAVAEAFEKNLSQDIILAEVEALRKKYQEEDFSFELVEVGGGYKFLTKPSCHHLISIYLKQQNNKRLSQAAMETLSIIAYKQPISKADIEQIRGVNSDYSVSKLLEKEFITIVGRSDEVGRALLYGTSPKFLDYFGLKSMEDLPKIKDFEDIKDSIGEPESINTDPAGGDNAQLLEQE